MSNRQQIEEHLRAVERSTQSMDRSISEAEIEDSLTHLAAAVRTLAELTLADATNAASGLPPTDELPEGGTSPHSDRYNALGRVRPLRELLLDWVDVDVAAYELGVVLGALPTREEGETDVDHWLRCKSIFWCANPLGDALYLLLLDIAKRGFLEQQPDPDLQGAVHGPCPFRFVEDPPTEHGAPKRPLSVSFPGSGKTPEFGIIVTSEASPHEVVEALRKAGIEVTLSSQSATTEEGS